MVSTHLKNISQNGNLPQIWVKIKNIWNHHQDYIHFPSYHWHNLLKNGFLLQRCASTTPVRRPNRCAGWRIRLGAAEHESGMRKTMDWMCQQMRLLVELKNQWLYKWYILPIGGLYATYHLLGEPETTIEKMLTFILLFGGCNEVRVCFSLLHVLILLTQLISLVG